MTTITRERLEWLSNISGRDDIEDICGDEIRELARIALASLDAGSNSNSNSNPAHGPLSNDRLHRISDILRKAAAQSDGGNVGYAMSDAVKAIDELLERAAAMLNHSGDVIEMEAIKQQSTMQPNNGAMSGDAVKQSSSNAQRR